MKKLMFQKELALIEQVYQKNVRFVITAVLKVLDLSLNTMFVIMFVMPHVCSAMMY